MGKRNNIFLQVITVMAIYLICVFLLHLYIFLEYVYFLKTKIPTLHFLLLPPHKLSPPSFLCSLSSALFCGLWPFCLNRLPVADTLHIEGDLSAVTCFPEADVYEAVTFVNLGSNSSPKAMQRAADIARKGEQLIETIWGMQY